MSIINSMKEPLLNNTLATILKHMLVFIPNNTKGHLINNLKVLLQKVMKVHLLATILSHMLVNIADSLQKHILDNTADNLKELSKESMLELT